MFYSFFNQKKGLVPLITYFRKTKTRGYETPKKRTAKKSTMQSPWDPGGAIYMNTPRGSTTPVSGEYTHTSRLVKGERKEQKKKYTLMI